ncbi:uncharacterized protein BDZ99DRAFT_520090 [Mytilinidion resinicola]|uniref:Uncharacterized protein n=1 Tax=Mytilinidion resinicola TaxID=574789 RepID=A0A6A6YN65_9PEZI|nr:uncharacterized protein BDZ99DRAFT_520090 [Mytilinidion resinicola]KAF2809999.1 hypothetical protein BDZ99DRAFT_520090 [Mytilinidion resinicola]
MLERPPGACNAAGRAVAFGRAIGGRGLGRGSPQGETGAAAPRQASGGPSRTCPPHSLTMHLVAALAPPTMDVKMQWRRPRHAHEVHDEVAPTVHRWLSLAEAAPWKYRPHHSTHHLAPGTDVSHHAEYIRGLIHAVTALLKPRIITASAQRPQRSRRSQPPITVPQSVRALTHPPPRLLAA